MNATSSHRRHALSFAIGALSALAFAPLNLWPLMIPAFALLLRRIDSARSPLQAFTSGWWLGFGQLCAGLYWLAIAWQYQAQMPAVLGIFAVMLLSALLALYAGFTAALTHKFSQSGWPRVLTLAVLWSIAEYLRGHLFSGFSWNSVGSVWIAFLPVAQISALIGPFGVSLLTVAWGASFAIKGGYRFGVAGLAIVAVGGGLWLWSHPTQNTPGIQVHVVQANVGEDVKQDDSAAAGIFNRYLDLSEKAVKAHGPGIIIWPETAVPPLVTSTASGRISILSITDQPTSVYRITRRLLASGGQLITGIDRYDEDANGRVGSARNSLAVMNSAGVVTATYDKHHLVPYGEYLPMRTLLEPLGWARLVPGDIDFAPGSGPVTLAPPGLPAFAPLICYEAIFADDVVARHGRRPQWIVNISNDSWYGRAAGPEQALAQGRLRAIEQGLPMVRATPTGISAMIDAHGRLTGYIKASQAAVLTRPLPAAASPTVYARFGDWVFFLLCGMCIVVGYYDKALLRNTKSFGR